MIPIQMELGGKDACIVCHDADLDLAAKNIVKVSQCHYSVTCCTWSTLHMLLQLNRAEAQYCVPGQWMVKRLYGIVYQQTAPGYCTQLHRVLNDAACVCSYTYSLTSHCWLLS